VTTNNPGKNAVNIVNGVSPPSPRTGGNEYVWHCHILEHEEHDMMHALVVQ
jgi:FtsP/CotA-like multicopper oxidase with cupredoxin domain